MLFVHLTLADMQHFAAANAAYCAAVPQATAPARACVQAPLPRTVAAQIEVLVVGANIAVAGAVPQSAASAGASAALHRKTLHVQSVSCWAPACIGPYSQATECAGLVSVAGQVPLDPPTMQVCHTLARAVKAALLCASSQTSVLFVPGQVIRSKDRASSALALQPPSFCRCCRQRISLQPALATAAQSLQVSAANCKRPSSQPQCSIPQIYPHARLRLTSCDIARTPGLRVLGKWPQMLLKHRQRMPAATKQKIQTMTAPFVTATCKQGRSKRRCSRCAWQCRWQRCQKGAALKCSLCARCHQLALVNPIATAATRVRPVAA